MDRRTDAKFPRQHCNDLCRLGRKVQTNHSARPVTMSIAAVERDIGLSKDTLRVWERRYGFPLPGRDAMGERIYPFEQVERLRTIKRLLDAGHRPGRIVAMAPVDLEQLVDATGRRAAAPEPAADLVSFMAAIGQHDVQALRQMMAHTLSRIGLGRFVLDVVAPLNVLVGDAWMQGRLEVFEEHLYTESIQVVLRNALHHLPAAGTGAAHLAGHRARRAAWLGAVDGRGAAGAGRLPLRVAGRADAGVGHRARHHGAALQCGGATKGVHVLPTLHEVGRALADWHLRELAGRATSV